MTDVLDIPLDRVLDEIRYVPGRWIRERSNSALRYIVLHSMEAPETDGRALSVANYFATVSRKALTHFTTDNHNVIRCAPLDHGVYGAAGTNWDGIHVEQPGYASQSNPQWLEPYNLANFEQVGRLMAAINLRYGIPLEYVGVDGLRRGVSGVVTHYDCTIAFNDNGGHTDPGRGYPHEYVLSVARRHAGEQLPSPPEDDDMPAPNQFLAEDPRTGEVALFTQWSSVRVHIPETDSVHAYMGLGVRHIGKAQWPFDGTERKVGGPAPK